MASSPRKGSGNKNKKLLIKKKIESETNGLIKIKVSDIYINTQTHTRKRHKINKYRRSVNCDIFRR